MSITVDLWCWRLDDPDPRALSAEELARAARFVHARDRDHYIAGRARMRAILGAYLGLAAADITFRYGPHGRPAVDGARFNLSHTGELAQLAITRDANIGVDIENVAPIDMAVARAHFAPSEVRMLMSLPRDAQMRAFYLCWTRKEAYLKALGTGLTTDLSSFTVTLAPDDPPCLLDCATGDAAQWRLFDLVPAPGVVGALALSAAERDVSLIHHA